MDERGGRLGCTDGGPSRIVPEGPDDAVRAKRRVGSQPGRAPAEAGQTEPLETLGEGPQLVEAEGLGRPGDELLTHGGPNPPFARGFGCLVCRRLARPP